MPVVRELVTKLSFRVDRNKLRAFDQKVGAIRQNVRGLSQNLQGVASGVQRVGVGLTGLVTLPLTALGAVAVKTSADLEKAKIALELFLGSEEAALEKQKELIEFAKETPFQVLGIQETAGQLLAAQVEADKLIPTMNALGNAAKGNSDTFQRLVLNFAQVKTQGKLTGRDLRDFLVNQVPLVQLLSKELGVAESSIQDMTSKGQISFKDVEAAFMSASKEGGFFFDLMKKQSKTLSGQFSNLQDTVTQLFDEFGKAIDKAFNLRENIKRLIGFVDRVRNSFVRLSPQAKKLIVFLTTLIALVGPLALGIGTVAVAVIGLTSAAAALNVALLPFILTIGAVVAAIAAIGIAIFLLIDDFQAWRRGGNSVIGSIMNRFNDFFGFVKKTFAKIKAIFTTFWAAITTNSDQAWSDFISAFVDGIIAAFEFVLVALGQFSKRFFQAIWAIGEFIVKAIAGSFMKAFELAPKLLARLGGFGKALAGALFGGQDEQGPTSGGAGLARLQNFTQLATPAGSPPSTAAGGLERSISNRNNQNNLEQNIEITVPPGTDEQQAAFLEESAKKSFGKMFNTEMTKTLMAAPLAEQ